MVKYYTPIFFNRHWARSAFRRSAFRHAPSNQYRWYDLLLLGMINHVNNVLVLGRVIVILLIYLFTVILLRPLSHPGRLN